MESESILIVNKHAKQMRSIADQFVESSREKYPGLKVLSIHPKNLEKEINENASDYKRIIVAGGDGTVATAAHALAKSGNELGLIPGGTVNSFIRSLEIPNDLDEALEIAVNGQAKSINLGLANDRYLTNAASLGLTGEISDSIPDELKAAVGSFGYLSWGLYKFATAEPFVAELEVDGKHHELTTYQLIIANTQIVGSFPVEQGVSVESDNLVIIALGKDESKLQHIKNLLLFASNNYEKSEDITVLSGKKISIKTTPQLKVDIDGEIHGKTPLELSIIQNCLNVVMP